MSKILSDLNWAPDPSEIDPRTWRSTARQAREDGDKNAAFDFNHNHEPWEFPLMSDLAKSQRVQYWALDEDSDAVLKGYCTAWAKDILAQEEKYQGTSLWDAAQGYQEALNEVKDRRRAYENHIKESIDAKRAASGLSEEEFQEQERINLFGRMGRDDSEWQRTREFIRAEREAKNRLHGKPMKNLMLALVDANYEVSQEGVRKYCQRLFSGEEYLDELGLDYYMESSLDTERYSYRYHVFAFPGENLPVYFYDEMVFMNYVQTTVGHEIHAGNGEGGEIALLERAMENGLNPEWFEDVLASDQVSWQTWWT